MVRVEKSVSIMAPVEKVFSTWPIRSPIWISCPD
jgi:hypothetical protein